MSANSYTYKHLPGLAVAADKKNTVELYYPDPSSGSGDFTDKDSNIIGFVRFDLDPHDAGVVRLHWFDGSDPGTPRFTSNYEVTVTRGATYYDCQFELPDSSDPDSTWSMVEEGPGYRLHVKIKRKVSA